MDQQQQGSQQPSSSKVERKVAEKTRRNHMKNLQSKLISLLPTHNPKDTVPRPEQIDEATNYIKSLKKKVKMAQEKKEMLVRERKRTRGDCSSSSEAQGSLKLPKFEIHETGNSVEVILTCGVDDQFMFRAIIRMLHEENVEVISANSSTVGDSVIHVVHGEVGQSNFEFGASKVSEKLKWFVKGSFGDVEMETDLMCDFELDAFDPLGLLDLIVLDNGLPPNPL